jgi:hypothetical protein
MTQESDPGINTKLILAVFLLERLTSRNERRISGPMKVVTFAAEQLGLRACRPKSHWQALAVTEEISPAQADGV